MDSHKRYSQVSVETMEDQIAKEGRIQHQSGSPRNISALADGDHGKHEKMVE